ncbi:tetratricopeptide repeat protein [Parvibaculaceae bacterium PLY_AMNH_Bact1]|nr:tetratricopeptide repeat protein [Parvibaculaceae bacterium PLY_AMNH_Bact1]
MSSQIQEFLSDVFRFSSNDPDEVLVFAAQKMAGIDLPELELHKDSISRCLYAYANSSDVSSKVASYGLLDNIAACAANMGNTRLAYKLFNEVYEDDCFFENGSFDERLHLMCRLGMVCYAQGNYSEAASWQANALGLADVRLAPLHYAEILSQYSCTLWALFKRTEALEFLNRSMTILNSRLPQFDIRVTETVVQIATIEMELGHLDDAIYRLMTHVRMLAEHLQIRSTGYVRICSSLAKCFALKESPVEALYWLEKALPVLEFVGPALVGDHPEIDIAKQSLEYLMEIKEKDQILGEKEKQFLESYWGTNFAKFLSKS